jgi:hypothetical protein
MDANKAAYWIALGVLALGLNSEYRQGNFPALHRVVSRAENALCRISTDAQHTLAMARALTSGNQTSVRDLVASASGPRMARDQAEQLRESIRERVRAQAKVLRAQAEMQRAEIEQTRSKFMAVSAVNGGMNIRTVVCPKTRSRVFVSVKPEVLDVSGESDDTL